MFRQAGVSTEVRAKMSSHSIEAVMRYGRPKTRETERAAEALDEVTKWGNIDILLMWWGHFYPFSRSCSLNPYINLGDQTAKLKPKSNQAGSRTACWAETTIKESLQ